MDQWRQISRNDTFYIQIFKNGFWILISNEDFDNNDAHVICKQLGYETGEVNVDKSGK